MKIITWNINGYRSAKKEFLNLVEKENPDIICLQEIKMNESILDLSGYNAYYNFADKKGYSGVAVFVKKVPLNVTRIIGHERFDQEGRFLLLEFKEFILINIYIPHGGRRKENHPYKFDSIDGLIDVIKNISKNIIIATDFNIAHSEIDLKNYKTNYNNNMFSPLERAKIDELLSLGLIDTFRELYPNDVVYSMWPNGFDARKRNMGWRIDYIFASNVLKNKIRSVRYLTECLVSDHAPLSMEFD